MAKITVDFTKTIGKVKPMHAVNNGPIRPARMFPKAGNFESYKALCLPYARNHDAAFCASYGGEHTVDINAIFPNFDADPYNPDSYDFACTDKYTQDILDAGTKVFYRLGNKIDHRVKKYDSLPPKDYKKWAVICEHIIKHYNEGWANGFFHNIEYWEIWNEPENGAECWYAPFDDFLPFYVTAAKHLKDKFPSLKIGGPAFATYGIISDLMPRFLAYVRDNNAPLDFFSWHLYRPNTEIYEEKINAVRQALDSYGFTQTESILNEWNYVINWHDGLYESKKQLVGIKGAVFYLATMITGQNNPLDMLMYYDARPTTLNGIFDIRTYDHLKGYYAFWLFSQVYQLGTQTEGKSNDKEVYVLSAVGEDKQGILITYFTNNEKASRKKIKLNVNGGRASYELLALDKTHDAQIVGIVEIKDGVAELSIKPNSAIYLR
ncbi:MAG: hypothetical protein J6C23_09075 [Clostridia bacterium]|nr:hypothetical protein [Clostridia bacterium]